MWDDPVSAHANRGCGWAEMLKTDGKEERFLNLQSVPSAITSKAMCHKPCTDPFLTSVCLVAVFMADVNSGSFAIFRHLLLLWLL